MDPHDTTKPFVMPSVELGKSMHNLATELWPINRSIMGEGVRETLAILQRNQPKMEIMSVPTGFEAYDWRVPDEWFVNEAWVEDNNGKRIIDIADNNLHLMGYSEPIDKKLTLQELDKHIYSIPERPDAVPYVTSYYKKKWGFCISHRQRESLVNGKYRVVIRSELKPGQLNYGEILLKGKIDEEIFLSTYVCHPSMANNELSGPVVSLFLANWLLNHCSHYYSYRFVFIPETIGSLVYLKKNLDELKRKVVAGYNVTCVGDERAYSLLPSRNGNTISDRVAKAVLKGIDANYITYSWLQRGSDERQYCAPGVDLPIASIMRSKYGEYPEYHSSLDDLNFVTPMGLHGGLLALCRALECLETNCKPKITTIGEPQLGPRGLYSSSSNDDPDTLMNLITYCDGRKDLIEIAEIIGVAVWELYPLIAVLRQNQLV